MQTTNFKHNRVASEVYLLYVLCEGWFGTAFEAQAQWMNKENRLRGMPAPCVKFSVQCPLRLFSCPVVPEVIVGVIVSHFDVAES
jgi:hypothetical protein